MIRFQTLGDGNCLYNTEAVWLIYAYQQGLLDPLLNDKNIAANFAKLLTFVAVQEKLPEISNLLNDVTPQNIKQAFDTFILRATNNNNDIDWIKLQQVFAGPLRVLVVDAIKNNPDIRDSVKANLTLYINNMINLVQQDNSEAIHIRALYLDVYTNLHLNDTASIPAINTLNEKRQYVETEFHQKIDSILGKYSLEVSEPIIGKVRADMTQHVTATLMRSEKEDVQALQQEALASLNTFLSGYIQLSFDNLTHSISAHFEGMTSINNHLLSLYRDPKLHGIEQIRQAFMQWFFEGQAPGFNEYIHGIDGIAVPGVNAGELEQMILSVLLNHGFNVWSLKHLNEKNRRAVDGFKSAEEAKHKSERKLIFDMQKLPGHWNAMLPNNPITQKMRQLNKVQWMLYAQAKSEAESNADKKLSLDRVKKVYGGSFAKHNVMELRDLSAEQYCRLFGITLREYIDGSSPASQKEVPPPQNPPEIIPDEPLEVPPDPQEVPVPPPQEVPVPTPKPEQRPPIDVPPERDWFNYLTMMWTFAASLAMLTYGVIWPLWFPMMTVLFAQTVLAPFTYTLSISIAALFCFGLATLLTEKLHADWERTEILDNLNLPQQPPGNRELERPSRRFFSKYGNQNQSLLTKAPVETQIPNMDSNKRITIDI